MAKRKKPGPPVGATYDSADVTKLKLINATIKLLRKGKPVSQLTALEITKCAKVDKMYVRRFFGDRDRLYLETILHIATSRPSLIGAALFNSGQSGSVDPDVVLAFTLFTHLARNPEFEPQLLGLAEAVLNSYQHQIEKEFGLSGELATRQAVLGLMALIGFLTTGHLLPVDQRDIAKWLESRRDVLRILAQQHRQ